MSTWKAAIVSAPSSTNMPALQRNANAMKSAAAVMRLMSTTPAAAATIPIVSTAKTTAPRRSKLTRSAPAPRSQHGFALLEARPQRHETAALQERDEREHP